MLRPSVWSAKASYGTVEAIVSDTAQQTLSLNVPHISLCTKTAAQSVSSFISVEKSIPLIISCKILISDKFYRGKIKGPWCSMPLIASTAGDGRDVQLVLTTRADVLDVAMDRCVTKRWDVL